ncbi:MAG: alkaline phosphatase family protein, partial [Gemmatimonadaceae bacterium]
LTGVNADDVAPNPNRTTATTPADFFLFGVDMDPRHEFGDVFEQITGLPPAVGSAPIQLGASRPYPAATMQGFVRNFLRPDADGKSGIAASTVMDGYRPQDLPVLNALASEYAVCDQWFSSLPGPTVPNRLFFHAASSGGLDDSPGEATDAAALESVEAMIVDGFRFDNGTVFDRIDDACRDWLVFEGDETPWAFGLSGMNFRTGNFVDFEDFEDELEDLDPTVSYIFIEPDYGRFWDDFTCGNSQHPLDDVTRGEQLIKDVYEKLRNSSIWETSMLVITYDEHGGFYDHVPPPQAPAPGDGVTDPEHNQHDFDFRQLGVRVPAVVVSPWIPKGVIDHRL